MPSKRTTDVSLGDVAFHPKRNLFYVYEFHPRTERLVFLRLDTFINGLVMDRPHPMAKRSDVVPVPKGLQQKATRASQSLASVAAGVTKKR